MTADADTPNRRPPSGASELSPAHDHHHGTPPIILSDDRHPLARLNLPFILAIRLYQVTLSPLIGRSCRFYPTCSHYALAAYRHHHALRATWLTVTRIGRCNPLCRGGYDPAPGVRPDANPAARNQPGETSDA